MRDFLTKLLSFLRQHPTFWLLFLLSIILYLYATLLSPASPRVQEIHLEAYRYGFSPARIHARRGDRLRFTFSTRDTGQSLFLSDYDLHVVITPGAKTVEVYHLSRPDDPPQRTEAVEFAAGLSGHLGWLVSKSSFRNHTYNGPLHGTERGELIVEPNLLWFAGLLLLTAIPFGLLLTKRKVPGAQPAARNLFFRWPGLKRLVKNPNFPYYLVLPILAFFYFVLLAGFFGSKVSGRNPAPMTVWVLWLSLLILVLVPLGGRIWCLLCPIPIPAEWWQRRRSGMAMAIKSSAPAGEIHHRHSPSWPAWLTGAWPRLFLFLLLATFSTVLIAVPAATGGLLIGLVGLALLTAFFPQQRLFCRHLCPINAFLSLYAMTGRLLVRHVSTEICANCREHFCFQGNRRGWGCPYGLCMETVDRNYDCGMCTECIRTCSFDNVAVFWRRHGWDRRLASYGEAWQAIVMFTLAAVYCLVHLGSWDVVRDAADIIDKKNWLAFGISVAAIWTLCLGIMPLLFYAFVRAGKRLSRSEQSAGSLFIASSAAFIPLGLSVWMAFSLSNLLSMLTFVLQSLSDPFNWGWDLLGTAGSRWHIYGGAAIPWLQTALILSGFFFALRTLTWGEKDTDFNRSGFRATLPPAIFLWIMSAGLITFFAA